MSKVVESRLSDGNINAGRDTNYRYDYISAISNEGGYCDQITTGTLRDLNTIVSDSLSEKCRVAAADN